MNSVNSPIVNLSEISLVRRATAGERDARRELFERHRDAAYHVALRITGREADALDVVQDSFIRAFERLGEFRHGARFQTWLLRIVTNRALDLLRARKVRLAIPLDGGDDDPEPALAGAPEALRPGRAIEDRELADRLQRAVDSLPSEQRAVFALHAVGEMTYGQIAEIVGVPIGTVMSRLYHARRRLRKLLDDLAPKRKTDEQR